MRYLIMLIFVIFAAIAQAETTAALQPTQLLGTWQVDLRPTPDAKPYFQSFVVTKVNPDNSFEGTFYGAPISHARINKDWGAIRIAFVTADQSGPYNHSAVLQGRTLQGLTNSTGRGFLSYWSAAKQ
jgi:hypothetical protein